MTIEKASELLSAADIWAQISWTKSMTFCGSYEDIYEMTEQPRSGFIYFYDLKGHIVVYAFDQVNQNIKIITEPLDMGIQYLAAMRLMAQEVAER